MEISARRAALVLVPGLALTALAAGALPAGAGTTPATTVTLAPAADTFGNTLHAATAYGTTADIRVGKGSGGTKVTFIRFAIPAADAPRVSRATLVLTRTAHHLPATAITARTAPASWTEKAVTAKTEPSLGATLATKAVSSATMTVSLNVTAAAKGQTAFAVGLSAPITTDTAIFNSRQAKSGAPKLVLTLAAPPADPAPTTPSPAPTTTAPTTTAPTTTAPTTTAPTTTAPTTTAPTTTTPVPDPCPVSDKLVAKCQVWFGDAPQAYTHTLGTQSARLAVDEGFTGRKFDIVHQYKTNGTLFPNDDTIALIDQGRMLSANWKPATDMTWAAVAAGRADARIDAEAAYLKSKFDRPFFLSIYHEPEDNVNPAAGSGMTTADYVAMYRHTVQRLRADGATKFVTVMNYMGYYRWDAMRDALYPGDDVVDWIAWDPYMHSPGATPGHDFAALVNTAHGASPGFYDWATSRHPGTPLMIGEYGVYDENIATNPTGPAQFYASIATELPRFPALRALDHFTMDPRDVAAGNGTSPTETSAGLAAWQTLAESPVFNKAAIGYQNGKVVLK